MYQKEMAACALGQKRAPLVLKNAMILNVFTNEWIHGDIALYEDTILGVGSYEGEEERDLEGKYVVPGFIDAHLHLESTLLNPSQLIHQALQKGTTTFIVDPHEAANVAGTEGIQYMIDDASECDANVYVMMPSCVPSVSFELNGAVMNAEQMEPMMKNPHILGLGEVMDVKSVLDCEPEMMKKLELFKKEGRMMDGHGGNLSQKDGACYRLAGIRTDHECTTYEDALREARNGIQILIREGTAAKNLEAIVQGILRDGIPTDMFSFCTDDKHIEDIAANGHISFNIKKAITLGMRPLEAYRIASWNTARCYGLDSLGAVAPGYQADLVVLNDPASVDVCQVYHKGHLCRGEEPCSVAVPEKLLDTVHVSWQGPEVFDISMSRGEQPVIHTIPGEILTDFTLEEVPVKDGKFCPDETYQKILVFERHHASGIVGKGILKGFSIHGGAIATTVSHDSHNLIVIGDDDASMNEALSELIRCKGGYTIVRKGSAPLTQPLEIMGLMTAMPHKEVAEKLEKMMKLAREMGIPEGIDPFITMSFLALPVIPKARITPRGIYQTENGCWHEIRQESENERTGY